MSLWNCQVQRLSVVKGRVLDGSSYLVVSQKDHLTMRSPQTHLFT